MFLGKKIENYWIEGEEGSRVEETKFVVLGVMVEGKTHALRSNPPAIWGLGSDQVCHDSD